MVLDNMIPILNLFFPDISKGGYYVLTFCGFKIEGKNFRLINVQFFEFKFLNIFNFLNIEKVSIKK